VIAMIYIKTFQFRYMLKLHSFRLQVQPMGGRNAQDFSCFTSKHLSLRV
jgi:hypothetical protein